jgi:hypothetical protein
VKCAFEGCDAEANPDSTFTVDNGRGDIIDGAVCDEHWTLIAPPIDYLSPGFDVDLVELTPTVRLDDAVPAVERIARDIRRGTVEGLPGAADFSPIVASWSTDDEP